MAHLASMAAQEQGKFWPFHDKVFGAQDKMDKEHYLQYAKDLGMDVKKFEDSINTAHGKPTIDADANEGKALGVSGTPAFFINGHFLSGARPLGDFASAINSELTRLKIAVPPAAAAAASPAPPAGG